MLLSKQLNKDLRLFYLVKNLRGLKTLISLTILKN